MAHTKVSERVKQIRPITPVALTTVVDGKEEISDEVRNIFIMFACNLNISIFTSTRSDSINLSCHSLISLDKMIFKIESYWANHNKLEVDAALRSYRENAPFYKCMNPEQFVVPPFTLIKFFLQATCDEPLKMVPFSWCLKQPNRASAVSCCAPSSGCILC